MSGLPELNRIVYAAFATPRHSGGVAVIIDHVRMLRAEGLDAFLWLPGPDPIPWIESDVALLRGATAPIGADDVLVVPEVPLETGHDPAPGARTVVFNQNHFYTFAADGIGPTGAFPDWVRTPDVWTVSREAAAVLGEILAPSPVHLVRNHVGYVEPPLRRDRVRVSWLPKKRPHEAALLHRLLLADDRLGGVELCPMVDLPHPELVDVLRASTVFVALGHSEGFGLPVAEALAAGCLVTGYDGGGGVELFEAPGAWTVPAQRPLVLREQVVDLVTRADELTAVAAANREWVRSRYSPAQTRADLAAALTAAMARPARAATAVHPAGRLVVLPSNFTRFG